MLPAFDAAVAAREGAPSDGQPTGQPGRPDVPSVSKRIGESCTLPPPLHLKLFNQRYLMCFISVRRQHVSAILPPGWLCYGRFSAARTAGHVSISLCAPAILCIGRRVRIRGGESRHIWSSRSFLISGVCLLQVRAARQSTRYRSGRGGKPRMSHRASHDDSARPAASRIRSLGSFTRALLLLQKRAITNTLGRALVRTELQSTAEAIWL